MYRRKNRHNLVNVVGVVVKIAANSLFGATETTPKKLTNFTPNQSTIMKLCIEIYEKWGEGEWAQAKYLVQGYSDVLWTNDIQEALDFLEASLVAIKGLN